MPPISMSLEASIDISGASVEFVPVPRVTDMFYPLPAIDYGPGYGPS